MGVLVKASVRNLRTSAQKLNLVATNLVSNGDRQDFFLKIEKALIIKGF